MLQWLLFGAIFLGKHMTAEELIRQAFFEIGKKASQQPISGDDYNTAIIRLNALVSSTPTIPNYTVVTSSSDEITCPDYCDRWLTKALALDLAPQYGQLESYAALKMDKEEAWIAISRSLVRIGAPQLNGNVPYGSGNRMPGNWSRKYYPETDNGILTEQNAQIVVEDDTE